MDSLLDLFMRLYDEDEWRKKKAMQLPAPKYTDSNPMPFLERMQTQMPMLHQKSMEIDERQKNIYNVLNDMDQMGMQQGIGKVPRNLLELLEYQQQDDLRKKQYKGLLNKNIM